MILTWHLANTQTRNFFFFLTLSSTKPRLGSEGKIDDQLVNYMLGAWNNTKGIWP